MKIGNIDYEVRLQVWASPGEEQTLDELISSYGDRVIEIDRLNNRILVGESTHA